MALRLPAARPSAPAGSVSSSAACDMGLLASSRNHRSSSSAGGDGVLRYQAGSSWGGRGMALQSCAVTGLTW
jgi:hypothetical protein